MVGTQDTHAHAYLEICQRRDQANANNEKMVGARSFMGTELVL